MMNILVTGGNGQLATCIKDLEKKYENLNMIYTDYQELDICDLDQINSFFQFQKIHYCINCAAYTAVDNAEKEKDRVYEINAKGAKNLALVCKSNNTVLIHISTDFVFDGEKNEAYTEVDETNPISVYGRTKLKGEQYIQEILENHFIIRTSWLYSEHGSNFMKTMLRLSEDRNELSVVHDQIGTPTYAGDLAYGIFRIIEAGSYNYGIYNYSNLGKISWFDFAKAIFEESNKDIKLTPIKSEQYPTPAKRPMFSVLEKTKIIQSLNLEIPYWRNSLKKALIKLKGIS